MAEISPGEGSDVQQALLNLMDRVDRLEEQLDQTIARIAELEERVDTLG
jgi:hypothetical protein